jgi:hypothetical protein
MGCISSSATDKKVLNPQVMGQSATSQIKKRIKYTG